MSHFCRQPLVPNGERWGGELRVDASILAVRRTRVEIESGWWPEMALKTSAVRGFLDSSE